MKSTYGDATTMTALETGRENANKTSARADVKGLIIETTVTRKIAVSNSQLRQYRYTLKLISSILISLVNE